MGPNELLFWMSARQSGSWFQFRTAVEELGLNESHATGKAFPAHQLLRLNLERHAHVEFGDEDGESTWRVAPAVLVARMLLVGLSGFYVVRARLLCWRMCVQLRHRLSVR